MTKYIIRGSIAGVLIAGNCLFLYYNGATEGFLSLLACFAIGVFSFEFIICLICYHHALWNQDQTEQKLPDGTK